MVADGARGAFGKGLRGELQAPVHVVALQRPLLDSRAGDPCEGGGEIPVAWLKF